MIFTHKYRASKNRLDENCGFQKICVMKNQNFPGQTPRQSDSLTKGSISRLQGLNRKKREIWQKYLKSQLNIENRQKWGPWNEQKTWKVSTNKNKLGCEKVLEKLHYQKWVASKEFIFEWELVI